MGATWVGYLFVVRQHVNANADRLLIPDHAERTVTSKQRKNRKESVDEIHYSLCCPGNCMPGPRHLIELT
jgi:hypothetical protein